MGYELTRVLDEMVQDAERFRRQENPLVFALVSSPPEALVDGIEPEGRELWHHGGPRSRHSSMGDIALWKVRRQSRHYTFSPSFDPRAAADNAGYAVLTNGLSL